MLWFLCITPVNLQAKLIPETTAVLSNYNSMCYDYILLKVPLLHLELRSRSKTGNNFNITSYIRNIHNDNKYLNNETTNSIHCFWWQYHIIPGVFCTHNLCLLFIALDPPAQGFHTSSLLPPFPSCRVSLFSYKSILKGHDFFLTRVLSSSVPTPPF